MSFIKDKILIFTPRYKNPTHIAKFTLTSLAIACTLARLALKNQITTRAHTLAISMGFKSLVFLAYEVFTEKKPSLQKWKSLKAYWILNFIEIVTWMMVVGLMGQVNAAICSGAGCGLSWVVVVIALVLAILSAYMFLVTFREYLEARSAKKSGGGSGFQQYHQHSARPSHKYGSSRQAGGEPPKEPRVSEQHLQPYSIPRTYWAEQQHQQQRYEPYSQHRSDDRMHVQYPPSPV